MPDDRSNVREAVSMLRPALLFLLVDLNIGSINVLPAAAGSLICLKYLPDMEEVYPGILRIRPLCQILAVVGIIDWFLKLQIPVLSLVMTLLQIYVVHAELSGAAAFGKQEKQEKAVRMIGVLRNAVTALQVLLFAFLYYIEQSGALLTILWISYAAVVVLLEIWLGDCVS